MYLLQILLNHLLQVFHDADVGHGHSIKGFLDFVGIENELSVVGDVGVDEMDVLVGRKQHHQRASQVAHGRTVEVVVLEPEVEHCAFPDLALNVHAATSILGVHLDERQSQPDLARGA